jgi:hypothetical protein
MCRSLWGLAVLATLLAGCVADPYYNRHYGGGYDDRYDDDRGYHDDDRRDHHHDDRDRDRDRPTIVCASKDGRPSRCHTDFPIQSAELDKRYSGSPCEYGRSWGFDNNEVWVDRGCRARFRLYPAGRWR